MRSRTTTAALLRASPETHAEMVADLLQRAQDEIQRLGRPSVKPGMAFFISEADQIDVEGGAPDIMAKHGALRAGDPWVELLPIEKVLGMIGDDDGGRTYDSIVAQIRRKTQAKLPLGTVWFIVALGGAVAAFAAEVAPGKPVVVS